ncbi:hypothetical protein ACIBKY_40590 [Nonomuraea sp. NPDC050394]|uniref:hypothetical protein n=1 Tax=Nonomuraea sp. NPDC050394 TaxID=3364363 RepID=UPI00379802FE
MTFELICEIEPPTKPDLKHVRHQIGTLSKIAHSFLIPDNHTLTPATPPKITPRRP